MSDPKEILAKFQRVESCRRPYEKDWADVRRLVRPYGKDFFSHQTASDSLVDSIFDGTAPDALEDLASGLQSFLTNPTSRWFELSLELSDPADTLDEETRKWLDHAADAIFSVYSDDETCFNQSVHEVFLDSGGFGNGYMLQEWDPSIGRVFFVSQSASSCYVEENYRGFIDTVFNKREMTFRQLASKFPDAPFPEDVRKKIETRPEEVTEVIHMVHPREGYSPQEVEKADQMAYESCWVHKDSATLLKESGYDFFPWHVSRWVKLAGEVYGRSPATKCLPDIRMLNQMQKTIIRAAEKIVDPPLIVENDSVLLPLRTSPGSLIYKEPGSESPVPLEVGQNIPLTLEMVSSIRDHIKTCFYSDWLKMDKAKLEMTATEVMDRREEKLRFIAPVLGRQQSEFLGPLVKRTLNLLLKHGRLQEPPDQIKANKLKVGYISSAAKAQLSSRAGDINRYIQALIPLAQIDQQVFDSVKLDQVSAELGIAYSVPRSIIRAGEELDQYRQSKAEAQSMQQAAEIAKPMSEAAKNVAQAQAQGLDVMSML